MTMHETSKRSRRSRTWKRRVLAFTLMEAVLVVGIIGIISAIGMPALLNELRRQATRGAARSLHSLMQQGRLEAISSQRPVVLAYSLEPLTGSVTFWNPNGVGRTWFYLLREERDGSLEEYRSILLDEKHFLRGPAFADAVGTINSSTFTETLRDEDLNDSGSIDAFEKLRLTARFFPNGTVSQTGGLRISDTKARQNTFEVAIADISGRAELRKYLCEKSNPNIILEEFHPEPDLKSKYRWVWF
jgi:Tfp pilus assembly protein FimT